MTGVDEIDPVNTDFRHVLVIFQCMFSLGENDIQVRECLKVVKHFHGTESDFLAQAIKNSFDRFLFVRKQGLKIVVQFDARQRFDKNGLAAGGKVVDYALDLILGIRSDRQHQTVVADRDNRIRQSGRFGIQKGVHFLLDSFFRYGDFFTDRSQFRGSIVIDVTAGIDSVFDYLFQILMVGKLLIIWRKIIKCKFQLSDFSYVTVGPDFGFDVGNDILKFFG